MNLFKVTVGLFVIVGVANCQQNFPEPEQYSNPFRYREQTYVEPTYNGQYATTIREFPLFNFLNPFIDHNYNNIITENVLPPLHEYFDTVQQEHDSRISNGYNGDPLYRLPVTNHMETIDEPPGIPDSPIQPYPYENQMPSTYQDNSFLNSGEYYPQEFNEYDPSFIAQSREEYLSENEPEYNQDYGNHYNQERQMRAAMEDSEEIVYDNFARVTILSKDNNFGMKKKAPVENPRIIQNMESIYISKDVHLNTTDKTRNVESDEVQDNLPESKEEQNPEESDSQKEDIDDTSQKGNTFILVTSEQDTTNDE